MKIAGIEIKPNLSRIEEIKIFTALTEAFSGTGNYLESFFSPEVLQTVTRNIEDDICPESVVEKDQYIFRLLADLGEARKVIDNKSRALDDLQEKHEAMKASLNWAISEREERIQRLKSTNEELSRKARKLDALRTALQAATEE